VVMVAVATAVVVVAVVAVVVVAVDKFSQPANTGDRTFIY